MTIILLYMIPCPHFQTTQTKNPSPWVRAQGRELRLPRVLQMCWCWLCRISGRGMAAEYDQWSCLPSGAKIYGFTDLRTKTGTSYMVRSKSANHNLPHWPFAWLHCKENPIYVFQEKKTVRPQSQFSHSCICERNVYSHDRSTYFSCSRIGCRPFVEIYKSPIETWM